MPPKSTGKQNKHLITINLVSAMVNISCFLKILHNVLCSDGWKWEHERKTPRPLKISITIAPSLNCGSQYEKFSRFRFRRQPQKQNPLLFLIKHKKFFLQSHWICGYHKSQKRIYTFFELFLLKTKQQPCLLNQESQPWLNPSVWVVCHVFSLSTSRKFWFQ